MIIKGRFSALLVPDRFDNYYSNKRKERTDQTDQSVLSVYRPYGARVPPLDCTILHTNISII